MKNERRKSKNVVLNRKKNGKKRGDNGVRISKNLKRRKLRISKKRKRRKSRKKGKRRRNGM